MAPKRMQGQFATLSEIEQYTPHNAPDRFAHLVFKTAQPDRMVDWYCKVFDAQVVFRNPLLVFLTYDRHEHHRIAIVRLPKLLAPVRVITRLYRKMYGLDHVAFTFGDLGKLLRNYRRLKQQGIVPVWAINHGPTTSLYYEDPDGNRFEFQVDNFATLDELQSYAQTDAFLKNPIGVNFDPDYLLEQLESGVPERDLLKQGAGTRPGTKSVAGLRALSWKTL
jgi:catechol-2,3-dioxygenase